MLFLFLGTLAMAEGPYMANGIKIGEVDQTTAIIWTRLTSVKKGNTAILNAAPGCPGEVRIVYQSKNSQKIFQKL